ncbi:MAG: polyhydroxyalkanoate granule-associated phasin [Burkholderiales bacterium]
MATRRARSSSTSLATRSFELSVAAPQVVAHRLTRMMAAGPGLSPRDQKEFMGMGTEKMAAFGQSWAAMWMQACTVQMTALQSMWRVPPASPAAVSRMAQRLVTDQAAGMSQVLSAGLKPIHAKAVSNARRLSRKSR